MEAPRCALLTVAVTAPLAATLFFMLARCYWKKEQQTIERLRNGEDWTIEDAAKTMSRSWKDRIEDLALATFILKVAGWICVVVTVVCCVAIWWLRSP